jgi:hypothetical protein
MELTGRKVRAEAEDALQKEGFPASPHLGCMLGTGRLLNSPLQRRIWAPSLGIADHEQEEYPFNGASKIGAAIHIIG